MHKIKNRIYSIQFFYIHNFQTKKICDEVSIWILFVFPKNLKHHDFELNFFGDIIRRKKIVVLPEITANKCDKYNKKS